MKTKIKYLILVSVIGVASCASKNKVEDFRPVVQVESGYCEIAVRMAKAVSQSPDWDLKKGEPKV